MGTLFSVIGTVLIAYPLSRKRFFLRKPITLLITFTMFFSAGMIPNYILIVKLGLYNTRWAIVVPSMIAAYYAIVARSFFSTLPEELFESARIDGANEGVILLKIVLPISKPILAALTIFYGTAKWNAYFDSLLYLSDQNLHPMQIYLRKAVIDASISTFDIGGEFIENSETIAQLMQVKYAVIIVTIAPVVLIYPLLQKYFVKGMLIGAIKG